MQHVVHDILLLQQLLLILRMPGFLFAAEASSDESKSGAVRVKNRMQLQCDNSQIESKSS